MSTPANWFPDPYGRFAQRYWDGSAWTAHVIDGDGKQSVDPMGTSTVIPIVTPSTATGTGSGTGSGTPAAQGFAAPVGQSAAEPDHPSGGQGVPSSSNTPDAPAAPSSAGLVRLLDEMRPDSATRPRPSLESAFAGGAGAIAGVGLLSLLQGSDGTNRGLLAVGAVLSIAIGLALRLLIAPNASIAPIARSAGVGFGVVGIAGVAGAVASNPDSLFLPFFVAALLYVAAWLLPGFRGRTIMLGLGALALVTAVAQLAGQNIDRYGDNSLPRRFVDQGYLFLILGALLLGATWFLDRRGYHGTGTAFVASGLISSQVGVVLIGSQFQNEKGGLVLAALVGLLICYVGSHGGRRATTWWGAAIAVSSFVALVGTMVEPSSPKGIAGALILAAALIVAILLVVRAVRSNSAAAPPVSDGSDALR